MQLLDLNIVKRKAIAAASTTGLSVREMKNKDFKAVKEIDALMAALFN